MLIQELLVGNVELGSEILKQFLLRVFQFSAIFGDGVVLAGSCGLVGFCLPYELPIFNEL